MVACFPGVLGRGLGILDAPPSSSSRHISLVLPRPPLVVVASPSMVQRSRTPPSPLPSPSLLSPGRSVVIYRCFLKAISIYRPFFSGVEGGGVGGVSGLGHPSGLLEGNGGSEISELARFLPSLRVSECRIFF